MSSRYAAARPRRAGEAFARAHHGEEPSDAPSVKKVKFDVRNPSALAPSAEDAEDADDDVLAADVIGGAGRATKRGAVNIDGYDSDSDNETFNARAEARGTKGTGDDVDLAEAMDNYNKESKDEEDEEELDMFGGGDDDSDSGKKEKKGKGVGKKDKSVRFLAAKDIEGQVASSRSGGTVHIDDDVGSGSEDEEDAELAREEDDVDEEVGAGGSKRHAPKIDAFNMEQEQEEGAFDEAGNFIRKAVEADAVHDRWLEGLSKKQIRAAAQMHEKRDALAREKQREEDKILTADLFRDMILNLERGETALEALARLGKGITKPKKAKPIPKWKKKKQQQQQDNDAVDEAMDVDKADGPDEQKQRKIKEAIDTITDAADKLLKRDFPDIYDTERELLVREYRNEAGEPWVDPPKAEEDEEAAKDGQTWEYRWTDGRDDTIQGPFDGPTMGAWQNAGYFGDGVEFRHAGDPDGWTRAVSFV